LAVEIRIGQYIHQKVSYLDKVGLGQFGVYRRVTAFDVVS
jgi:hypothetical protein